MEPELPGCTAESATNHDPNATVDDGSCLFAVTFQADLSCSEQAINSVYLNGTFNDWCGTCTPMFDDDLDGVYEIQLSLPSGDHQFKYVVNEDQWEELDPTVDEACTTSMVNDGATYTNRLVQVVDGPVTLAAAQPGACEACPKVEVPGCTDTEASNFNDKATTDDETCKYPVTFQLDMTCYDDFSQVFLAGDFNEWCGDCSVMTDDDADMIYTFTADLPLGPIEFKYVVDETWEELSSMADVLCTVTKDDGEFINRILEVEGPEVLPPAAPSSCEPCAVPECGDGQCEGAETWESCPDDCKNPELAKVTFNVELGCSSPALSDGDIVYVMGLDNWGGDQIGLELKDDDGNGVWQGTWEGPSGEYEYVLSFGHWMADTDSWNVWYGKEDLSGQPCATEEGNRTLSADGVMELNLIHGHCEACPGDVVEQDAEVEFSVHMGCSTPELSDGDLVYVMGLDKWGTESQIGLDLTDEDGDGVWTGLWIGDPGEYEYTLSFGHWLEDQASWSVWYGKEDLTGQPCATPETGNRVLNAAGEMKVDLTHSYCGVCPGEEPPDAEIEFSVDMGCSAPELSEGDAVYVMGLDAWDKVNQVALELTDEDQDGVWTGLWSGQPGDYEYALSFGHYLADEGSWNEWYGKEDISGQACASPETGNRMITADGSMQVALTHSYCDGCPGPEPEEAHIEFSIDMTCPIPAMQWTQGGVVYVMGLDMWGIDFELAVTLHDKDKDGIWTGDWTGPAGDYEYVLSFGDWMAEEAVWSPWFGQEDITGQWCADPETGHRSVTAQGSMQLNLTHSYCDGCPAPEKGGCTDAQATNTDPEATYDDGSCLYPVTFQVDMSCYGPFGSVYLNGPFNEWCGGCWSMTDEDSDGIYTYTADLPPGGVEYKFTVDDTWENLQPGSPCTVTSDEYTNRYLEVSGAEQVPASAPGSCGACE